MQYRKKPIVIEAIQYTGDNARLCLHFMGSPHWLNSELHETDQPIIHTLEGDLTASVGDWIIKGIKGEFEPCKPDVFEATYESTTENPTHVS